MATRTVIISGEANQLIKQGLEDSGDFSVKQVFDTASDFVNDLNTLGVTVINNASVILLMDYGFSSSFYKDRWKDFVLIQESLRINNVKNVRFILVTRDSDLYGEITNEANQNIVFRYENTSVFIYQDKDIRVPLLKGIMKSEYDHTGKHHPRYKKSMAHELMEEKVNDYIDKIKTFENHDLDLEKEPTSQFAKRDFVDDAIHRKEREKQKREQELRQREEKKRKKQNPDVLVEQIIEPKVQIRTRADKVADYLEDDLAEIEQVGRTPRRTPRQTQEDKALEKYRKSERIKEELRKKRAEYTQQNNTERLQRMRQAFDRLKKKDQQLLTEITVKKGVVSVVSPNGIGASGLVANFSAMYALNGYRVLTIDLDVEKRSQQNYHPTYDQQVAKHYGIKDGLIKALEGGRIEKTAVSLTSKESLLGVSLTEPYQDEWQTVVREQIDFVVTNARALYDIILLDIPREQFFALAPILSEIVDKHIFVLDNKLYNLRNFSNLYVARLVKVYGKQSEELLRKSNVIFNQYNRAILDEDGREVGKLQLKGLLRQKGYPYDRILLGSALPYYPEWESQYVDGLRYVFKDAKAKSIFQSCLSELKWREQ